MKKISLRIVTPKHIKDEMEVDMVIMRLISGDLGILPGHLPISGVMARGVLRVINDGTEQRMAVHGGIMQVKDDVVSILTNKALWPGEIDLADVESQIEKMKRQAEDELTVLRDSVMFRDLLVQQEVSTYPLLTKTDGSNKPT